MSQLLKRKRCLEEADDTYVPSPKHVLKTQTPPSEGRKKSTSRESVRPPTARKLKIKLKTKPLQPPQPSPPHQSPTPLLLPQQPPPSPQQQPPQSPPQQSPIISQHILQTPPTSQPPVQATPGSSGFKDFPHIPENIALEDVGDFSFVNNELEKKLQQKVDEVLVENNKLVDSEKKLEKCVKTVESENSSLLKKVEADQAEIDILKVRIAELEEEKSRRDDQNKYFELKNKELEANNARKEHENDEESIELEEVRARRKAEMEAQMKDKGKGVVGEKVVDVSEQAIVVTEQIEVPISSVPLISSVSGIFDVDVEDDDEEDDDEEDVDDADDVFSASSHDDDGNDDDQGTSGIKVTEELNKENVDGYLRDDVNYKYIEEADNYDRVEVEDWSDDDQSENANVDTSNFPMLVEFFSQANIDELRRKVEECLKDKNFDGTKKDERREERQKWFMKNSKRKLKRPLKYYKRDRELSLGDIISWGFLPQKPHQPKKVKRVDPATGIEETILQIKKPRVLKNIPLPKMEHDFHKGFLCWVYSCLSTEAVITYKLENEIRYIHLYNPMWIINCSAKDIECLFMRKICFKAEDKDQAMQFQKVVTIFFQKGINSENAWSTKWRKIEKEEDLKAEKRRKE
ncbi:hypothetical protein Hanom_Chr06g00563361 [Helianthus anomalus]